MAEVELLKAKRTLYLLIFLLLLNLGGTGWLIWRTTSGTVESSSPSVALPEELRVNREQLFHDFVRNWNKKDAGSVYEMFDPTAQVQLQRQEATKNIQGFMTTFGSITDNAWSHHKFEGRREEKDWFDLYYKVRFEGGAIPKGTVKISVFFDGERYGMTGFKLIDE